MCLQYCQLICDILLGHRFQNQLLCLSKWLKCWLIKSIFDVINNRIKSFVIDRFVMFLWILRIMRCHCLKKKKNFMAPFYRWSSTFSRLEPLWGGSLLFTIRFPDIPGTHFIDLGRMKGWVNLGATQCFRTQDPWTGNSAPKTLGHCSSGFPAM